MIHILVSRKVPVTAESDVGRLKQLGFAPDDTGEFYYSKHYSVRYSGKTFTSLLGIKNAKTGLVAMPRETPRYSLKGLTPKDAKAVILVYADLLKDMYDDLLVLAR